MSRTSLKSPSSLVHVGSVGGNMISMEVAEEPLSPGSKKAIDIARMQELVKKQPKTAEEVRQARIRAELRRDKSRGLSALDIENRDEDLSDFYRLRNAQRAEIERQRKQHLLLENVAVSIIEVCAQGRIEDLKYMIANKAELNHKSGPNDNTGLMMAVKYNHTNIVNSLVAAGADVDIQNANGQTALMMACGLGRVEMVNLLIDSAMAQVDLVDSSGYSALMYAVENGYNIISAKIIKALSHVVSEKKKEKEKSKKVALLNLQLSMERQKSMQEQMQSQIDGNIVSPRSLQRSSSLGERKESASSKR